MRASGCVGAMVVLPFAFPQVLLGVQLQHARVDGSRDYAREDEHSHVRGQRTHAKLPMKSPLEELLDASLERFASLPRVGVVQVRLHKQRDRAQTLPKDGAVYALDSQPAVHMVGVLCTQALRFPSHHVTTTFVRDTGA